MELKIIPRYLVDENGNKSGVLLDISDYQNLIESIEDLEDQIEMLTTPENKSDEEPYQKFRQRLKAEGKL